MGVPARGGDAAGLSSVCARLEAALGSRPGWTQFGGEWMVVA